MFVDYDTSLVVPLDELSDDERMALTEADFTHEELGNLTLSDFYEDEVEHFQETQPELYRRLVLQSDGREYISKEEETARETRIEEFVEKVAQMMKGSWQDRVSYEKESALDYWFGYEGGIADRILEWRYCDDDVKGLAEELLERGQEEEVNTIFNDQSNYDVSEGSEGEYFSYPVSKEEFEIYADDGQWMKDFLKPLHEMSEDEFDEVVRQLNTQHVMAWQTGRHQKISIKAVFDNKTCISYDGNTHLVLEPKWDEILKALQKGLDETEPEEAAEDEKVYEWKDGSYMTIVPLKKLRAEGAALGICVGREDMPYRQAVAKGTTTIYSIRTKDGKPKFTIEHQHQGMGVPHGKIAQIKGKANRLPGFAAGKDDQVKPEEVEKCEEVVVEFFQLDPNSIRDLKPGLKALAEWREARARKVAEEKAAKLAKRASRDGPRENPSRRNPATIPVSAKVAKMAQKAYERPWGGQWGA